MGRTVDEVRAEIARRQEAAQSVFPGAEPEAFAYNLVQEALHGGRPYRETLDEVQTVLDAVRT